MSTTFEVIVPGGAVTDITARVRLPGSGSDEGFSVTASAEEGAVGSSEVIIDDPDGDLDLVGFNAFRIREDTATGSNTNIWVGGMADRTIIRGPYRTGVSRQWRTALIDLNQNLVRRILTESYADRPRETDVARITALLGTSAFGPIDDTRYFSSSGAVTMDARDWRGETAQAVLDDCAQQSGKNYFVWYAGDTDELSLFYDFSSSDVYKSPLRLSNDLDDVDNVTTFAMSLDTEMRRDPSRVASGIYLQWGDSQAAYEQDISTAVTFSHRDLPMDGYAVKTQANATARAQRYLADAATEEDVITTSVILPAAKVNFLMQGMRVQFRGTHFPDYDEFTWGRILTRTVTMISEDAQATYEVRLEISAGPPSDTSITVPCEGSIYPATASGNYPHANSFDSDGPAYYGRAGFAPPTVPTTGYTGHWHFGDPAGDGPSRDHLPANNENSIRIVLVGAGSLTVNSLGASTSGISWQLFHENDDPILDDSGTAGGGSSSFSVDISTHGGTFCVHYVEIQTTGPAATGWDYVGIDWVSAE